MARVTVRVDGADQLRRAIRQAKDTSLAKMLATTNKDAADVVVRAAKPAIPRRTGRLAASVRALGSQRSGRAVAGRASVPYAAAIHWGRGIGNVGSPPGNRRGRNPIRGRPFLSDAAQQHQQEIVEQYEQGIRRLLADAFGRLRV